MTRHAACLFLALTVAGCAGGGLTPGATPAEPAAELSMPGRWMLSAPNAPACGMNFSAAAGKSEGAVMPEGGCPGRFYTSRRWTLDNGALTIIDDGGEPLAKITFASGRFDGQSAAGMPITLMRNDDTTYK